VTIKPGHREQIQADLTTLCNKESFKIFDDSPFDLWSLPELIQSFDLNIYRSGGLKMAQS
jgi:hypothetical protein